jgi:hypothetical protein
MTRIGTDVLLFVNMVAPPGVDLQVIACQRDATFTENTAVIDLSCKTQREQRVAGGRYSAEITMDSLYVADDNAYQVLVDANRSGDPIMVARLQSGLVFGIGEGVVTSLSERFPDAAESTVSATIVIDQVLDTSTTNLVTNPSFETNTTGWAAGGANVINCRQAPTFPASVDDYSLECDYQDNVVLAEYAITLTEERHALGIDVYVPLGYLGDGIQILFDDFTGATDNVTANVDMDIRDQWQRVFAFTTPVIGDLIGVVSIQNMGTDPDPGNVIYIDGVQVEALPYATPYCDGDQGPGHEWTGTAHASTSTRV